MSEYLGWLSCAICGELLVCSQSPYGHLGVDPRVAEMTDILFDGKELDFTPICLCSAKDRKRQRKA